jgi:hypothetical protein
MKRICTKCGIEKDLEASYSKDSRYAGGYHRMCKDCIRIAKKNRKENHKIVRVEKFCPQCKTIKAIEKFDVVASKQDGHHDYCSDCRRTYLSNRQKNIRNSAKLVLNTKHCNKCNKEKNVSEFGINNNLCDGLTAYCKECTNEIRKGYYYIAKDRETPEKRLKMLIKKSIRNAFSMMKIKKTKTRAEYGIDMEFIFEGVGEQPNEEYQLDHIIPLAMFDYNIEEHIYLSQHPRNLRWIEWETNLKKSDFIDWSLIFGDEFLEEVAKKIGIDSSHDGMRARDIKLKNGIELDLTELENEEPEE